MRQLFVYGTLRRDSGHPMAAWLAERAAWLGPAQVPGRLVDLGGYPGLVEPLEARDTVEGEVWELREERFLGDLDRYEGCHPEDPPPHEYARVTVRARMAGEQEIVCWGYRYLLPAENLSVIHSGDWYRRECI